MQILAKCLDVSLFTNTFFCFMSMQTLLVVDEKTDISYNIAAEAAGGLVSARDFINLRHWGERNQTFFIAVNKATFPDMPPQKKYVRYGLWTFKIHV